MDNEIRRRIIMAMFENDPAGKARAEKMYDQITDMDSIVDSLEQWFESQSIDLNPIIVEACTRLVARRIALAPAALRGLIIEVGNRTFTREFNKRTNNQ